MIVLSWMAYYVRQWRALSVLVSLTCLPFLLLYFYLPESPRWLHGQGRVEEANKVLAKIAEGNE